VVLEGLGEEGAGDAAANDDDAVAGAPQHGGRRRPDWVPCCTCTKEIGIRVPARTRRTNSIVGDRSRFFS
jgi:hypothetical protein